MEVQVRLATMLRGERRVKVVRLAVVTWIALPVVVVMLSFAPVNQPGNARAASAHFDAAGISAHKNFPTNSGHEREASP